MEHPQSAEDQSKTDEKVAESDVVRETSKGDKVENAEEITQTEPQTAVSEIEMSTESQSSSDTTEKFIGGTESPGGATPMNEVVLELREHEPLTKMLSKIPHKIQRGIRTKGDLTLTCLDANEEFIAFGSNVGILFLYDRKKKSFEKLKSESSMDSVTCVQLHHGLDHQVAVGFSSGSIHIYQLPSMLIGHSKQLQKFEVSDIHSTCLTCVAWSINGMKLYSGDNKGFVGCTEVDFEQRQCKSSILMIEKNTEIVQLHHSHRSLLVSTKHRCVICRTDEQCRLVQVGSKDRKSPGNFGACFLPGLCKPDDATLYAARPGFRIWKAKMDGSVSATYMYKDLLNQPHKEIPILQPGTMQDRKPAGQQFGSIILLQEKFIVTWNQSSLYVLNPENSSIIGTQEHIGTILSVSTTSDGEIFILRDQAERLVVRLATNPLQSGSRILKQLQDERERANSDPKLENVSQNPNAQTKSADSSPLHFLQDNLLKKVKKISEPLLLLDRLGSKGGPNTRYRQEYLFENEGNPAELNLDLPPIVKLDTPDLLSIETTTFSDAKPLQDSIKLTEKEGPSFSSVQGGNQEFSYERSLDSEVILDLPESQKSGLNITDSTSDRISVNSSKSTDSTAEQDQTGPKQDAAGPGSDGKSGPGRDSFPLEKFDEKKDTRAAEDGIVFKSAKAKKKKKNRKSKTGEQNLDTLSIDSGHGVSTSPQLARKDSPKVEQIVISGMNIDDNISQATDKQETELNTDVPSKDETECQTSNTRPMPVSLEPGSLVEGAISGVAANDNTDSGLSSQPAQYSVDIIKQSHTEDILVSSIKLGENEKCEPQSLENASPGLKVEQNIEDLLQQEKEAVHEPDENFQDISKKGEASEITSNTEKISEASVEESKVPVSKDTSEIIEDYERDKALRRSALEKEICSLEEEPDENGKKNYPSHIESDASVAEYVDKTAKELEQFKRAVSSSFDEEPPEKPELSSLEKDLLQLDVDSGLIQKLPLSPTELKKEPSIYSVYRKTPETSSSSDGDFYSKYRTRSSNTSVSSDVMTSPEVEEDEREESWTESQEADDFSQTVIQVMDSATSAAMSRSVNTWTELPALGNIYSLALSNSHIWYTDRSNNIYYSSLNRHGIVWRKAAGSARQIAVSKSGTIVWCLLKNVVLAGTKITHRRPEGMKWVEFLKDVSHIAVDDTSAWYIKTNGEVKMQMNLSKDRPHSTSTEVDCPYKLKQIVCQSGVVWGVTDTCGLVIRQGITDECPQGKRWIEAASETEHKLFSTVALGDGNLAWGLDVIGQLWFCTGVTMEKPLGNRRWWQVPFSGEYLMKDMSAFDTLKQLTSKLDPQKMTWLISTQKGGLICAGMAGVWVCPDYKHMLHVCRGSLEGHSWILSHPTGIASSTAWKLVDARMGDGQTGLVWAQQPNQDLFVFPSDRSTFTVIPTPRANLNFIGMSVCPQALWCLTDEGFVYIRTGMGPHCPHGADWCQLDLSQLGDCQLVSVSCGQTNVWAVDSDGSVYQRIGVKPPSIEGLNAAWLPVDSGGTVFTQITAGPQDWMVWAIDNRRQVYVRGDIDIDMPIGRKWCHVPGVYAVMLTVSNSYVWALNASGELFCRYGISQGHCTGDYWKKVPDVFRLVTASPSDNLWAINREGQLVRRQTKFVIKSQAEELHVTIGVSGPKYLSTASTGVDEGEWELV